MPRRRFETRLPPPYLRRIWLDSQRLDAADWNDYPFCLPLFARQRRFELDFDAPITIIVGENGVGKSTLIEAIARLAGFGMAGGQTQHNVYDGEGGELAEALCASWLPKVSAGAFFRAETFFNLAQALDEAARGAAAIHPLSGPPPRFLDHSHAEGFLRFFRERMDRAGLYIFDEPETALSPSRQVEFVSILRRMQAGDRQQVIMATHAPILMATPDARLLQMTKYEIAPIALRNTEHFRLLQDFCSDPEDFIRARTDE